MDIIKQNRMAWDKKVEDESAYTKPVSREIIRKSKSGDWQIFLTPTKAVPRKWFPASLKGLNILCLASGGGQQGPVLAAAGGEVTVVDLSEKQLASDQAVAEREGLSLKTVQGDMANLHFFADEQFDLIVHPVSNVFAKDILSVWKEASKVLKDKGVLLSGFMNPVLYIFDEEEDDKGNLIVANSIPYSSLDPLTDEETKAYIQAKHTIEFSHTLEDQIQGQIDAGFVITGIYEDDFGGNRALDQYIRCFMATRAVKMKLN